MKDVKGSISTIKNFMANASRTTCNEYLYEALQVAVECMEKQIPAQVTDIHVDEYFCPDCGSENCCDQKVVTDNYCPVCGRRIYQEAKDGQK